MLKFLLITITVTTIISCDDNKKKPIANGIYKPLICENTCEGKQLLEEKSQKDSGFSYLAFPNFGHLGIGRCRGHALLTQKMSLLASFKTGVRCDLEQPHCLNNIKRGVRNIMNFQAHVFTGFKNLREFSNTPKIKEYLRTIVANTSHRYKTRPAKITIDRFNTIQGNTYGEVQKRLAEGHLPYIGLNGSLTGSHAVLIYREAVIDNRNVLCARDPNFVGDQAESCENYLYMTEQERIFFKRRGKPADFMQSFKLTHDEELRVVRYKKALSIQCVAEIQQNSDCR